MPHCVQVAGNMSMAFACGSGVQRRPMFKRTVCTNAAVCSVLPQPKRSLGMHSCFSHTLAGQLVVKEKDRPETMPCVCASAKLPC